MNIFYTTLILALFLTSCVNTKMKNPEVEDLVYLDIQKDIAAIDRVVKLRETEIQVIRDEMRSLKVRSPLLNVKQKRIDNMSDDVKRFVQLKKYLLIKKKKRSVYAKILYELHYNDKDAYPWPDQAEYSSYLVEKESNMLPIREINKADSSRELTHKKDVSKILRENGLN